MGVPVQLVLLLQKWGYAVSLWRRGEGGGGETIIEMDWRFNTIHVLATAEGDLVILGFFFRESVATST